MRYLLICYTLISAHVYAVDAELAYSIAEQAAEMYKQGELSEAVRMARHALSFDSQNSDALYLSVSDRLTNIQSTRTVQTTLRSALDADNWNFNLRQEALLAYTVNLSRIFEYHAIITLLENEDVLHYNTDLQYYLTLAYYSVGDYKRAEDLIQQTSTSFDRRFFVLKNMHTPRVFPDYTVHRWLEENMVAEQAVLDLLRYYIEELQNISDEKGRSVLRTFIRYYEELGGEDPIVALYAQENDAENEDYRERFFLQEGHYDKYLIDRIMMNDALGELQLELQTRLTDFTGELHYDSNRDGYSEARYIAAGGKITEWHIDSNQDGIVDLAFEFDTGTYPRLVRSNEPAIIFEYSLYPTVGKMVSVSDDYTETWYPGSGHLQLPLLHISGNIDTGLPRVWSVISRIEGVAMPTVQEQVDHFFMRYRSYDNRSIYYRNGEAWLEVYDTNNDNKTDELYFLSGGVRLLSMHDRDYNAVFEYFVQYKDGLQSFTMVDEDNDNSIEYITGRENHDISFLPSDEIYTIEEEYTLLRNLYAFAELARQRLADKLYAAE